MSLPATWRQFQLFDFLPIRDPAYQSSSPLFSDPQLSAISAVQAYIIYAVNGHVKVLVKSSLSLVRSFCAYESEYRITYMEALPQSNIFVTVGENQGSPAIIKVWDLHKIMQLDDSTAVDDDVMCHKYITTARVHDGDDSYPISCFSFNANLTCIALGYTSGKVILVRGDLLRDRGSKQRLVYEGSDPITGARFHHSEEILYVVTTSKVFTLVTTGRNRGKPLRILSKDAGADLGCSEMDGRSSRLLVANSDGFTYYNTVGKAQVIGFSVPKRKILRLTRNYLLVVCPMEETTSTATRSTLTRLLVLDLFNMHISFSLTIPNSSVSHVFSAAAGHEAYLLSTDGVLYKLLEKPINQQIESIIQRELFPTALHLAKQHNLDSKTTMRINKLHAESLFSKKDYENSTQKFIDCLPFFVDRPASSDPMVESLDDFIIDVITKLKEVSNIHSMTKFLASLHEMHLADSDHLTLLLCCYCKLKMKDELDAFIAGVDFNAESSSNRLDMSKLNFTLIINLFKECGYYPQAILLLYKLNHPHMIADIQLNDLKDYSVCLSYIKTLPVNELLNILIDFSKKLLDVMPLETTKLLVDVFTGKYKPETSHTLFGAEEKDEEVTDEKDVEEPASESYVPSYNAILGYLSNPLKQEEKEATPDESVDQTPTYLPPRPSLVFSCFVNHSKEFVVFLEACHDAFDKYQGSSQERKTLITTLYEMYASLSAENSDEKSLWAEKAKTFLGDHLDSIDKSKAQLIALIYRLQVSDVFIKAKVEHSVEDAFRSAQMAGNFEKAFDITREFGEEKPTLYKQMLKFIVSSSSSIEKATRKDLQFLLEKVSDHKLAAPIEIIKILSSNEKCSIGIVKDFLIDYFGSVTKEITNNEKLIELYEKESTEDSMKLTELTSQPFILQSSLCSTCQLKLEFPAIFFKCKHAYHQRCLNENTYIPETAKPSAEPMCPLCASEIQSVESIRESQLRTKFDYDTFKMKLDESDDRFKVITEYIGRGVMEFESD
ncbi:hypothetical protein OXX79_008271 [Metschnikowia pulcherrima]